MRFSLGLIGLPTAAPSGTPGKPEDTGPGVANPIAMPGVVGVKCEPFARGVVTWSDVSQFDMFDSGIAIDVGAFARPATRLFSTDSFSFDLYASSRLISSSMRFANRYLRIHLPRLTASYAISARR